MQGLWGKRDLKDDAAYVTNAALRASLFWRDLEIMVLWILVGCLLWMV